MFLFILGFFKFLFLSEELILFKLRSQFVNFLTQTDLLGIPLEVDRFLLIDQILFKLSVLNSLHFALPSQLLLNFILFKPFFVLLLHSLAHVLFQKSVKLLLLSKYSSVCLFNILCPISPLTEMSESAFGSKDVIH